MPIVTLVGGLQQETIVRVRFTKSANSWTAHSPDTELSGDGLTIEQASTALSAALSHQAGHLVPTVVDESEWDYEQNLFGLVAVLMTAEYRRRTGSAASLCRLLSKLRQLTDQQRAAIRRAVARLDPGRREQILTELPQYETSLASVIEKLARYAAEFRHQDPIVADAASVACRAVAVGSRLALQLAREIYLPLQRSIPVESLERDSIFRPTSIKFQSGAGPKAAPTQVASPRILVLVGPNNSGKSMTLRELEQWCVGIRQPVSLVREVDFELPNCIEDAVAALIPFLVPSQVTEFSPRDSLIISTYNLGQQSSANQFAVDTRSLRQAIQRGDVGAITNSVLRLHAQRLDGRSRFDLSAPQQTGDLASYPRNHLWALFENNAARRAVSRITREALGSYFVIDPTGMSQFAIRLSDKQPSTEIEKGLDDTSRAFHQKAAPIEGFGDGVKAFVGLTAAAFSLPQKALLVDEPEAFLHPSLANQLGRHLTRLTVNRGSWLATATHSADFLMGCLEASLDISIVRLTFQEKVGTARALAAAELQQYMRDPLLRSTGALQGLFRKAVVVCESDSDRVLYQEVNRRLGEAELPAVEDAVFLNAQNWQTVARIMGPLRTLGVASAGIIDLDTLTGTVGEWQPIYVAARIPQQVSQRIEAARLIVGADLLAIPGNKPYKRGGIRLLPATQRARAARLIRNLAAFGVFVLPVGELEAWLPNLVPGAVAKSTWIVRVLEALGSDPDSPDYVRPNAVDVWRFIRTVAQWTGNPVRAGIE